MRCKINLLLLPNCFDDCRSSLNLSRLSVCVCALVDCHKRRFQIRGEEQNAEQA